MIQDVELGVHDEVRRDLQRYTEEKRRLPNLPAYGRLLPDLDRYPHQFFGQLCCAKEDEVPSLLASLNLLRAAIALAVHYRERFLDVRTLTGMAGREVFSGLLDLLLDLRRLGGLLAKIGQMGAAICRGLGGLVTKIPGGHWAVKGLQLGWQAFEAVVNKICGYFSAWLYYLAEACNKILGYRPRFISQLAGEVEDSVQALAPRADPGADWVEKTGDALVWLSERVITLGTVGVMKFLEWTIWLLMAFFALLIKYGLETVFGLFANKIGESQVLKAAKEYLTAKAKEIYDAAENWMGSQRSAGMGTPARDFGQVLLDQVLPEDDFDSRVAASLELARQLSLKQQAPADWQRAVSRAAHAEARELESWQTVANAIWWAEMTTIHVRFAVKLIVAGFNALYLVAEWVAFMARHGWDRLAGIAADRDALADFASCGSSTEKVEKALEILDVALVRSTALVARVVELVLLIHAAPDRIDQMYR